MAVAALPVTGLAAFAGGTAGADAPGFAIVSVGDIHVAAGAVATVTSPFGTLADTGGSAPYSWKGIALPKGLKIDKITGNVYGTAPIMEGTYALNYTTADTKAAVPPTKGTPKTQTILTGSENLVVDSAPVPSGVVCGKIAVTGGLLSGTVTLSKCTPKNKIIGSASAPAASLATGGTLTWTDLGTTDITMDSLVDTPANVKGQPPVPGNSCKYGYDLFTFTGHVSGASEAGIGVPAVGDSMSGEACVNVAGGSLYQVKGTSMNL
jgi:hypothetical protein